MAERDEQQVGQQGKEEVEIIADAVVPEDPVEFDEDLTVYEGEEQIVHLVLDEMNRDDVEQARQDILGYESLPREVLVASLGVFAGHNERLNKIMIGAVKAFRKRSKDLDVLIARLKTEIEKKQRSVFVNSKTGLPNAQCLWRDSTMYDAHMLHNNIPFLVLMVNLAETASGGKIEFQDIWNMGCLLNDSEGFNRVFALQDENQQGGYMIGIFSLNADEPIKHAQELVGRYIIDLQHVRSEGFLMGAAAMVPSVDKVRGKKARGDGRYVNCAMRTLLQSTELWQVRPQLDVIEAE